VSVNGIEVQALGTKFNINAYPNETAFRATLLEGSIKVSGNGQLKIIQPGEQVSVHGDEWTVNDNVAVSAITGWVNDQFKFKNNSIEEVMRMVERWYDAKVKFKDQIYDHFNGTIDRGVPVSKLLHMLSATGLVHFNIEGDTITVSK
jgi:transmembrane sensor